MRIFGSITYSHVADELRKKLEDKADKCIFTGYCMETKSYKVYNPKAQKDNH